MSAIHIHPNALKAIQELHGEIERLAVCAASSAPVSGPFATANNGIGDEMLMFYDADKIKVFCCNGGVYISGIEHFGYWPDWFALPREQARALAMALLSASAWVGHTEPEDDRDT